VLTAEIGHREHEHADHRGDAAEREALSAIMRGSQVPPQAPFPQDGKRLIIDNGSLLRASSVSLLTVVVSGSKRQE